MGRQRRPASILLGTGPGIKLEGSAEAVGQQWLLLVERGGGGCSPAACGRMRGDSSS